jgi:Anti-sigma factor NepR
MLGKHNAAGTRNMMNTDKPSPRIRTMYAQKSERNPVVKLGPDIKAKIGMQLRLMYGEIVDQGVPERFVEMLKRLDDPNYEGR